MAKKGKINRADDIHLLCLTPDDLSIYILPINTNRFFGWMFLLHIFRVTYIALSSDCQQKDTLP